MPLRNGRKCRIKLVVSELFSKWFYILFGGKMDIFPIVLYNVDEERIPFCVVYGVALCGMPVHL